MIDSKLMPGSEELVLCVVSPSEEAEESDEPDESEPDESFKVAWKIFRRFRNPLSFQPGHC